MEENRGQASVSALECYEGVLWSRPHRHSSGKDAYDERFCYRAGVTCTRYRSRPAADNPG